MKRANVPRAIGYVVCLYNREHPASLERGKLYRVCRDVKAAREGWVRVIDESGEDYLYPQKWFSSVKLSRHAARALASA